MQIKPNGETVTMPKEVYTAIEHLLDEFLWCDYPERIKYFLGEAEAEHNSPEEREAYRKAAAEFETAYRLHEAWLP